MKTVNDPSQLSLLPAEVTDAIEGVFARKEVKSGKTGQVVGASIGLLSRKLVAQAYGLQPKANKQQIDKLMLDARDKAWTEIKSRMVGLDADWTFHKITERKLGNGVEQISFTIQNIVRDLGLTAEAIAARTGQPVELIQQLIDQEAAKKAQGTLEVESKAPVAAAA